MIQWHPQAVSSGNFQGPSPARPSQNLPIPIPTAVFTVILKIFWGFVVSVWLVAYVSTRLLAPGAGRIVCSPDISMWTGCGPVGETVNE